MSCSCIASRTRGISHTIGTVALLSLFGSTHRRQLPSGFKASTTGQHHSLSTLEMTPTFTSFWMSLRRNERCSSVHRYVRLIREGTAPGFSLISIGGNEAGCSRSYLPFHTCL